MTDLRHTGPTGTDRDRFQPTYDPGSRITSVVTTPSGAGLAAFTTNFSYDRTDQLTGATSPVRNESYAYDQAGNRTTSTSGTDSRTYQYPGGQHANRIFRDGQYQYAYDDEGNLISKSKRVGTTGTNYTSETLFFTCDHRNRLIRVERRSTSSPTSTLQMSADYAYDVFNRRITKTVDPDGSGSTAAYRETAVYDGSHRPAAHAVGPTC